MSKVRHAIAGMAALGGAIAGMEYGPGVVEEFRDGTIADRQEQVAEAQLLNDTVVTAFPEDGSDVDGAEISDEGYSLMISEFAEAEGEELPSMFFTVAQEAGRGVITFGEPTEMRETAAAKLAKAEKAAEALDDSVDNTGSLVGGAVGGLGGLAVGELAFGLYERRKRNKNRPQKGVMTDEGFVEDTKKPNRLKNAIKKLETLPSDNQEDGHGIEDDNDDIFGAIDHDEIERDYVPVRQIRQSERALERPQRPTTRRPAASAQRRQVAKRRQTERASISRPRPEHNIEDVRSLFREGIPDYED